MKALSFTSTARHLNSGSSDKYAFTQMGNIQLHEVKILPADYCFIELFACLITYAY